MSKAICEPVRIKLSRKEACETCYFWDKNVWSIIDEGGSFAFGEKRKGLHPCCKSPNSIYKYFTEWCGEWKTEVGPIEESKRITDQRGNHNAIYRRQDREKVPVMPGERKDT